MYRLLKKATLFVFTFALTALWTCQASIGLVNPRKSLSTKYAVAGGSVDFDCRLKDPSLEVHLYHKDTKLLIDGVKYIQAGQCFTINNITKSDSGDYKLQTVLPSGVKKNFVLRPLRVVVIDTLKVNTNVVPSSITALAGGSTLLTCRTSVFGSLQFKSLMWYKDIKTLPSVLQNYSTNGNIHVNTLRLSNLETKDSGNYECRTTVTYYVGFWPAVAKLQVKDFKFTTAKRPDIFVGDIGSTLRISCETTDPNATVTLLVEQENSLLKPVIHDGLRIVKNGARFEIHRVTLKDGGKYICKAVSTHRRVISMNMGIFVPLQGGHKNPKAHIMPFSQTLNLGENFNFTCKAFGDAIHITWLKDGKIVPPNMVTTLPAQTYKGYTLFEAVLMIRGARKSDESKYTCQITNTRQPGYYHNVTANLTIYECLKPDGKFRDPFNSGGYIDCNHDKATMKLCLYSGQFWEDSLKQCVFPATTPTTPFLRWVVTKYDRLKSVPVGSSYTFDCRLTVSTVPVKLKRDGSILKDDGTKVIRTGQVFVVSNLVMGTDAGAYACSAPGIADSKREQLYVDLDLTSTLSVRLLPSFRVKLDTTFTQKILCQSYHIGKIHWYKVDPTTHALTLITKGTLEKDVRKGGYLETQSVLTLTSVTQKDAGIYMCRKNNSVQAVASETIEVKVKAPERPVVRPISPKTTLEHRTLVIKGRVSGSPLPDVTWYKGHKRLVTCSGGQLKTCQSHDKNYRAKWNRNARAGLSLTIVKTVYPADDGVFLVEVKNIAGSARAKSNVSVIVPPEIKRRGNQIVQKIIRKDSSDQFTCEVTRANPAPIFSWQYQQWPCDVTIQSKCKPLPNNWQQMPSRLARVKKALSTPMKSVLEVLPSKKLAYFRCIATNRLKTRQDTLVFAVMRTDEGSDLLVIKGKSTRYLNEHANITMTCTGHSVFSAPPYWLDPEDRRVRDSLRTRIVVNSSPLQNTTSLTLIGAQVNDSGKYTCVAAHKKTGTMSVSTVLKVLAVSSPTIMMSNQTVKETTNVMVNCTVSGHPRPDITWYKDGNPLELRLDISSPSKCSYRQNGFYHLKTIDSNPMTFSLVVCKAEYVNSGWYRCVATNYMGVDDQRAYLDILASPRIKVTPGPRKEGEPFGVQCSATGNPTPYVRWLKENDNGIFVATRNASSWRLGSSSMFFPIVGEEEYGKYRCVARNKLGERYSNYSLTVPPVSSKIVTGQSGTVSRPALTAIIVSGGLVILLLLGIIAVLYRRKKLYGGFYILTLPPTPDYIQRLDPCRSLQEQIHKLPLSADWEFSRDRLTLGKVIGSGAFGQVYRADAVGIVAFDPRRSIKGKSARRRSRFGSARSPYYNSKQVTVVACKGLKEDATESEFRDLVSELKILMHIGEHKNIVNLLGACTKGRQCDLWVIIEFCPHGNLLEFLRNRRNKFEPEWSPATEKPDEIFSVTDLVITAFQVARAMEFLASRRCVHRDLAARNVLVGENHVMKVADFGLARDIYKDEHYVKTTAGLLPVKWMAIEALVDRIYTHQSDVWSFGVLLWEIFTLGGSPYPGLPANEVYQYLMEGQRMNLPHDCPEEMYALMLNCWQHDPNERLQFSAILKTVDKLLEEKTTQTGEEYLELENEIPDLNENQPYYLQPEDIHPSSPPDTPRTFNAQSPFLPPLPHEEIEMESLIKKDPVQDDSIKNGFVLGGVPKKRRNAHGSDAEIEKACADTMETERQKKSDSSGFASGDDDFLSEKEHLMKDYEQDKDICERNSGVFDDSPSPYINTAQPYSNANGFKYGDDGACKKNGEARPRQQSARYV